MTHVLLHSLVLTYGGPVCSERYFALEQTISYNLLEYFIEIILFLQLQLAGILYRNYFIPLSTIKYFFEVAIDQKSETVLLLQFHNCCFRCQ